MRTSILLRLRLCSIFLFPLISQPLSLGLSIIFSTIFLCVLVALYLSSWYGYILFLIYVGGLLVIFAYVAALSPNVLFGGAAPLAFLAASQTVLPLILFFRDFIDLSQLTVLSGEREFFIGLKTCGIELVSPSVISVLIGLATILLVNLVVVVKICYYQHATLRPYKVAYANSYSKDSPSTKNS